MYRLGIRAADGRTGVASAVRAVLERGVGRAILLVSKGYRMSALLLRDVPESIRRRIKVEARKNRRSMTQEALVLLEQGLRTRRAVRLPRPIKPARPIDHDWLVKTMKEGRT